MMLVTLEEASAHLRRDTAEDDADLSAKIAAASGSVLNYLKGAPIGQPERDEQGRIVKDSTGNVVYERNEDDELVVRPEVKAAVLLQLGRLYRDRDDEEGQEIDLGFLPRSIVSLLTPLRDPACQ